MVDRQRLAGLGIRELEFADAEVERFRRLAADHIVSEEELESAELTARSRKEALEAAEKVLTRDGYHAFSTRRVAQECSISVGNLTYYFPTKSSLIEALMEAIYGRYERRYAELEVLNSAQEERRALLAELETRMANESREIERLAALVPPPRMHQLTYHGVLAPSASWRSEIVPGGERERSREVRDAGSQRGVERTRRPGNQATAADYQ